MTADISRDPGDALEAYGLIPEFGTLALCPTCLDLFDVPSRDRQDLEQQKCLCHRGDEPRWVRYDFNERARLCDCCAGYVLRSGSRWSVWFCPECKERVRLLNEEFGFATIPIGRHSMMNGFGLRPGAPGGTGAAKVQRFWERLQGLNARIDVLRVWKFEHLGRELERLGLVAQGEGRPRAVPLHTYLRAVAEQDRTSEVNHRLLAFRELADRFEVREAIDPGGPLRADWITPPT